MNSEFRSVPNASVPVMCIYAGGVFFWYGPLANLSLQIASVGSDNKGKNNGGPVDN